MVPKAPVQDDRGPCIRGGDMRETNQSEMKVRSATASYTIKASKALPAEAKAAQPPKPLSDKQKDRLTKLLTLLGLSLIHI